VKREWVFFSLKLRPHKQELVVVRINAKLSLQSSMGTFLVAVWMQWPISPNSHFKVASCIPGIIIKEGWWELSCG